MKRKGFTIIEVLGVMVILSVLALIIYPVISENIIRGKENALTVNIDVIEKATENWLDTNAGIVPKENFTLYLIDLKASGLIDKEIKNPKTGKKFPDDMEIQVIYDAENGKYVPNVEITTGTKVEEDIDSSRVVLLLKSTKVEYIEVNSEYTLKYRDEDVIAKYADGTAVNKDDIKITNHRYLNGSINEPEGFVSEVPSNGVELNTSKFYTYEVTYEVTNRNGITSRAVRKIIVRDTTPPTINVPANVKISKTQDSFNVDDEITYSDNSCKHKSGGCSVGSMKQLQAGSVDIGIVKYGNVVIGHVGEYTITYVAQDQSGNITKKTRTISIVNEECPTIKIKGTTESGQATYNKNVILTAEVSKTATSINEQGYEVASGYQWFKKDKVTGAYQLIQEGPEESYEVKDYFGETYKVATHTTNLNYTNDVRCESKPYETNIHLPKFECSVENIPDYWVRKAENLKVKLIWIDTGGKYVIDRDFTGKTDGTSINQTFSVDKYKNYTIKARNAYAIKTPQEINPQVEEGSTQASEIQAELNTQNASCVIGPGETNYDPEHNTFHQQIKIDDTDPNITMKLYNASTGTLIDGKSYKNQNVDKTGTWATYRYKIEVNVDDKNANNIELSGIKEFRVDGVLQNSNSYIVPIAPEGTKEYTFYVKDGVGRERTQTLKIKSDTTPPVCGTQDPVVQANDWKNTDKKINMPCIEDENASNSGCAAPSYSATYNGTTKTANIQIADKAKNKKDCPVNVYVDKTPPTCDITASGTAGSNNWFTSDTTVTAKGTDAHSGVASEKLKSNNQKTDIITQQTRGTVYAEITDKAGNSKECSKVVNVDTANPTCGSNNGSTTWTNANRTVTVNCNDSGGSGCAKTSYPTTFTTTTKTSSVRIYDKSGRSTVCSFNVYVDKTPPTCLLSASGTYGNNGWFISNVTVRMSSYSDAHSGVNTSTATVGGSAGTSKVYSGDTGGIAVTGTIKDKAGNVGNCQKVTIKIDKTAPSCYPQIYDSGDASGVSANIICSDNLSGVAVCNQGAWNLQASALFGVMDNAGHSNSCIVNVSPTVVYSKCKCSACARCDKAACKTWNYKNDCYTTTGTSYKATTAANCTGSGKKQVAASNCGMTTANQGSNICCQITSTKQVCNKVKTTCKTRKASCKKCGCKNNTETCSEWSTTAPTCGKKEKNCNIQSDVVYTGW